MKLPEFEYAEPDSIQDCCKLLSEQSGEAQIVAGGTDLLMALKNRLKSPATLVDISRISDLNQIHYSDKDGLKVGAMVTLRRFAAHAAVREKYPFLAQTALAVGDAQLQAMGTVGGNLCQDTCCLYYNRQPMWRQNFDPCHKLGGRVCHAVKGSKDCWATYCGDLAPALLVLQASIRIAGSKKDKVVPLNQLFSGDGKKPHTLLPDQLLVEIHIPPVTPHTGGTYLKMRVRKTIDYPLLGVAAGLTVSPSDNRCENISIALTGVEKSPILIEEEQTPIKGDAFDDVIESLAERAYQKAHPINNTYGYSPKYRREMVKFYVKSAARQSIDNMKNQGGKA
jgi:4-hydroxybenzoyl-CoA reductase subunit beta